MTRLPAGDGRRAMRGRQAGVTRLAGYDVCLSPTLAQLPARVGALRDDADPAADFAAQKRSRPSPRSTT